METRSLILCIFAMLPSIKANCLQPAQQSVSSINLYSSQNTLGVSDIEFLRQWRLEKYLSWEWNRELSLNSSCLVSPWHLFSLWILSAQAITPLNTSSRKAHTIPGTPRLRWINSNDKSNFLLARQETMLKLWVSVHKCSKGYREGQYFPRKSSIDTWFG